MNKYKLLKGCPAIVLTVGDRTILVGVTQLMWRKKKSLYIREDTTVHTIPLCDDDAEYIVELLKELEEKSDE